MSDDLISRQQAIDAVEESRRLNHHQDGKEACAHEYEHRHFLKILRDLPLAEPKIIHCEDCRYGMQDPSFPHQWFCKFKGDEWNNGDYFCGHARKREATT